MRLKKSSKKGEENQNRICLSPQIDPKKRAFQINK